MVEETLAAVAPLEEAGKFGAFLLQLTPAFAPKDHKLDELSGLLKALAPRLVAVELRHRGWVHGERAQETFDFLEEHGAAFVGVDAPPGDHLTIMPPVDAVTNPKLAYLRVHGRNTEGYLTGRAWPSASAGSTRATSSRRSTAGPAAWPSRPTSSTCSSTTTASANAPTSAREFRQKLGQDPGPSPAAAGQEQLRLA